VSEQFPDYVFALMADDELTSETIMSPKYNYVRVVLKTSDLALAVGFPIRGLYGGTATIGD